MDARHKAYGHGTQVSWVWHGRRPQVLGSGMAARPKLHGSGMAARSKVLKIFSILLIFFLHFKKN
jgi:hypothetical protein